MPRTYKNESDTEYCMLYHFQTTFLAGQMGPCNLQPETLQLQQTQEHIESYNQVPVVLSLQYYNHPFTIKIDNEKSATTKPNQLQQLCIACCNVAFGGYNDQCICCDKSIYCTPASETITQYLCIVRCSWYIFWN